MSVEEAKMEADESDLSPKPLNEKATKAWKKYVEREFPKEDNLVFSDIQLKHINGVIERLTETDQAYMWHALGTEYHRMFSTGYAERKDVVGDIVESVIETYKFRQEYNVKDLFKSRLPNHDVYHSSWPSYLAGEDNFGHFISFEKITDMATSSLEKIDKKDLFRFRTQHIEALMRIKEATCSKLNRRVCRYIFIFDLKGFSVTKHLTPKVKSILGPLFALSGDRYPESLWGIYLVNAPALFRMAWGAINKLVDPVVRAKIKMCGGAKEYIPLMINQGIPIESIPKQIGGEANVTLMSDVIDSLIDAPDDKVCFEEFTSFSYFSNDHLPTEGIKRNEAIIHQISNDIPPNEDDLAHIQDVDDKNDEENQLHFEAEELPEEQDPVLYKGYLEKRGWYNKSWKRRFFELKASGIYYYSAEPEEGETPKPRGKIDLLLVNRLVPIIGTFRNRGLTMWSKRSSINKRSRKIPLPGVITRANFSRHAVLGSFKTFSLARSSNKTLPLPGENMESTMSFDNPRSSVLSGDSDESLMGFDVVTPYRTYHLRVSDKDQVEEDGEAQVVAWVEAIGAAHKERMAEIEELMKEEKEVHKGFLQRKVRRRFGFFSSKFKQRYFILTTQRLYYYSDINTNVGAVLKGKVDLKKVVKCTLKEVPEGEEEAETTDFFLTLKKKNQMPLRADDAEDAGFWVEILNKTVEDYNESKVLAKKKKKEAKKNKRKRKKNVGVLILDEEVEEQLNRTKSVASTDSFSNISLNGMSDTVKGFFADAIQWSKDRKVIAEEDEEGNKTTIPSADEMYKSARKGVKKLVSNNTGRVKRKQKYDKGEINIEEVELD